jgi:hypothetical protein
MMSILGDGVAACCAAHLLGTPAELSDRPRIPALIVSGATQRLICDVFARSDIFAGLPQIEQRVVAWGADPVALPHRAVVISESDLISRLPVARASRPARADANPDRYTHSFGTRTATVSAITVAGNPRTIWIESLSSGWLFLLPGCLLAVGETIETLLSESHLVAPLIADLGTAGPSWPAHPRIRTPLFGEDWLACGTSAMAFDPICGDGVGNAIREGILAAAVARSSHDPAALREHYSGRLTSAFRRHLQLCREYYRTGGNGPWWRAEFEALNRGIAWCGPDPEFQFRLNGFDLERLSPAIR